MPHFSDQFDKEDPLEFRLPGLFGLWPIQCLQQCRDLLAGWSSEQIYITACALEKAIENQALHSQIHGVSPATRTLKQNIALMPDEWLNDTKKFRHVYGDLNFWMEARGAIDDARFSFMPGTTQAEALAVLALWKLVDSLREIYPNGMKLSSPDTPGNQDWQESAAANAMEAMVATTIAIQKKFESKLIAAAAQQAALQAQLAIKERVSNRHSKGAIEGHAKLTGGAKARTLQLATEKQFRFYSTACKYIQPKLASEIKCFVEVETVKRWLKEAGWTPTKRDNSKPKA